MQIKGKGLMVTYWLLGENHTKEANISHPSEESKLTRGFSRNTVKFKKRSYGSARGEFRHMSRKEKGRRRHATLQEPNDTLTLIVDRTYKIPEFGGKWCWDVGIMLSRSSNNEKQKMCAYFTSYEDLT